MAPSSGYTLFDTRIGTCGLAWGADGIRRVLLPEASRAALEARLRRELGPIEPSPPGPAQRRAIEQIRRHLDGKPARLHELELALDGLPPFRRRVYQALRQVDRGATVSYGELAARAGSPGAARAVGRAMATNPFPIVVPCHRVLAAAGKPGGFSAYGGTVTKAALLAIEGVRLDEPLAAGEGELPFDWDAAVGRLRRVDPPLGRLIRRVGPARLRLERARSTFAALSEAIIYQQLSGKAAATIHRRVEALFPRRRRLHPEDVARAAEATLRSAGLSRAKTAALKDLAEKTLAKKIPSLARLQKMDDEAIVEALTQVRGIGRWTVEMLLMFQLGRPDVLPVGDWGVRKGFARTFDLAEPPDAGRLIEHAERWRPHRTVGSWYMWRALELD